MKNIKHSNKTNNTFLCCNRGIFSKNVVALKRASWVAFKKARSSPVGYPSGFLVASTLTSSPLDGCVALGGWLALTMLVASRGKARGK